MSTFRHPVGPQPPSVYWRRRLIVGLALLAVIVVILLIVFTPRGDEAAAPPASPAASDEAEAPDEGEGSTEGDAAEGEECLPSVVTVEPVVNSNTFGAGELPQIGFTITNTGAVACVMNVGTTVQELRITSGNDLIWSSKDCQVNAEDATRILEPNVPLESPMIAWDRTRSDSSTCESERREVTAGGASYHLSAVVGGIESSGTFQFILR